MKRHETWRVWYRLNRYLIHLDIDELHQRGRDTFNVNMTMTLDGKIGILSIQEDGSEAIERFTHYMEECSLRRIFPLMGDKQGDLKESMPDILGERGQAAAKAISAISRMKDVKLFKFGKAKYLELLLNEGKLRIQPASSFLAPFHNKAVGDNEIIRSFKMAFTKQEILRLIAEKGLPKELSAKEYLEINIEYYTDYWVTCFARTLSPRLAVDFEADALIAIYDLPKFQTRLKKAFRQANGYHGLREGRVDYFDPYLPRCDFREVPLIKPFQYYYQKEYRFYWLPRKPSQKLQYVDLEMGNLEDICEMVRW